MKTSRIQSPESTQLAASESLLQLSLQRKRTVSNATDDASNDSDRNKNNNNNNKEEEEKAIAGPVIVDLSNETDDETITDDEIITDDDSDYEEPTKKPPSSSSSASFPQASAKKARTTSITDYYPVAAAAPATKKKTAAARPVEHGIVDQAFHLVTSATEKTLPSQLETIKELFSAPGKNGDLPNPSTMNKRWTSLLQKKLKPGTELQVRCQTYVNQNFKKNKGNRGPHKKIDVRANTNFIEKYWNGSKFLILPKKPAKGSFEEAFDPKDYPDWEIFKTYEYISHRIFVKEGLRNRLKPRALKDNTNAQRAETARGEKKLVIVQKVYCYPDGKKQPIVDFARTSDTKYPGASVFLLARIEDKNNY